MFAMLLNWKAKLAIGVFILAAAFGWHKITLDNAVENAIQYVQYENYKYTVKLQEQNRLTKDALEEENRKLRKESDEKLKVADNKYRALSEWVRSQPKLPTTGSSNPANPATQTGEEDSVRDIIGRLYRQNAYDLAEYARVTQTMAIELKMCYDWTDKVHEVIEKHNDEIVKIK